MRRIGFDRCLDVPFLLHIKQFVRRNKENEPMTSESKRQVKDRSDGQGDRRVYRSFTFSLPEWKYVKAILEKAGQLYHVRYDVPLELDRTITVHVLSMDSSERSARNVAQSMEDAQTAFRRKDRDVDVYLSGHLLAFLQMQRPIRGVAQIYAHSSDPAERKQRTSNPNEDLSIEPRPALQRHEPYAKWKPYRLVVPGADVARVLAEVDAWKQKETDGWMCGPLDLSRLSQESRNHARKQLETANVAFRVQADQPTALEVQLSRLRDVIQLLDELKQYDERNEWTDMYHGGADVPLAVDDLFRAQWPSTLLRVRPTLSRNAIAAATSATSRPVFQVPKRLLSMAQSAWCEAKAKYERDVVYDTRILSFQNEEGDAWRSATTRASDEDTKDAKSTPSANAEGGSYNNATSWLRRIVRANWKETEHYLIRSDGLYVKASEAVDNKAAMDKWQVVAVSLARRDARSFFRLTPGPHHRTFPLPKRFDSYDDVDVHCATALPNNCVAFFYDLHPQRREHRAEHAVVGDDEDGTYIMSLEVVALPPLRSTLTSDLTIVASVHVKASEVLNPDDLQDLLSEYYDQHPNKLWSSTTLEEKEKDDQNDALKMLDKGERVPRRMMFDSSSQHLYVCFKHLIRRWKWVPSADSSAKLQLDQDWKLPITEESKSTRFVDLLVANNMLCILREEDDGYLLQVTTADKPLAGTVAKCSADLERLLQTSSAAPVGMIPSVYQLVYDAGTGQLGVIIVLPSSRRYGDPMRVQLALCDMDKHGSGTIRPFGLPLSLPGDLNSKSCALVNGLLYAPNDSAVLCYDPESGLCVDQGSISDLATLTYQPYSASSPLFSSSSSSATAPQATDRDGSHLIGLRWSPLELVCVPHVGAKTSLI